MSHFYNNYIFTCNTLYKNKKKSLHALKKIEFLNMNFEFPEDTDPFTTVKGIKVEKNSLSTQLHLLFLIYITFFKKPVIHFNKKKNNFLFNIFVYRNKLIFFLLTIIGFLKPFVLFNYNLSDSRIETVSDLFYYKSSLLTVNKMNVNSKLNLDLKNLRSFLFFFNFKIN